MHRPGICRALDKDYASVGLVMKALMRAGRIQVVGKASDYGYIDVMSSAPVYGVAVNPVAQEGNAKEIAAAMPAFPVKPREKSSGKSGVIAGVITIGRGFRWGSGPV